MPDEDRVFDVSRPGRGIPQATSKPVIVGHRPTMNDPMMKDESAPAPVFSSPAATQISVQDDSTHEPAGSEVAINRVEPTQSPQSSWNGQINSDSSPANEFAAPMLGAVAAGPDSGVITPNQETSSPPESPPETASPPPEPIPPEPIEPVGHVEELHFSSPKRRSPLLLILLVLLALLIAGYLLLDSGLLKTNVNLPFHVFKQKAAPAATTSQPPAAPASTTPTGFTVYKISNTTITFAAPTIWGEPSSTTDQGYTSRSVGAKSDGAHAYVIDFATNKDVQVAVTSSKYLPGARTAQYFDFLQWCSGTSDSKIYLSVLQFTTTNKVDQATTVSCNQGPLTDATKLSSTTIVQLNSKNTEGGVFGDLYTKNLTAGEFTVFRVKDKTMKNGTEIKKLLNTVKSSAI